MPHLLVDITAHGFGHLAQTAAVLNALPHDNTLKITIRSFAPESILRSRIQHNFTLIPYQQDNGMTMHDALNVDAVQSFAWHQAFHTQYDHQVLQAINDLQQINPDLLFADVPYLSLEAAYKLQIPSVALCSLNWADVFQAYCGHFAGADVIHAQMLAAYQKAIHFLQPTPSMPMRNLNNTQVIDVLAPKGQAQPKWLRDQLQLKPMDKLVLLSLGGIGIDYPLHNWPELPNTYWIFPDQVLTQARPDWIPQSQIDLNYVDLLASCDVVLTKTGYGTQTEAVVNQVPTLCIDRGDWPEQPYLKQWHEQHGEVIYIEWSRVVGGHWGNTIQTLLERKWSKPAVSYQGAQQAAAYLQAYLQ